MNYDLFKDYPNQFSNLNEFQKYVNDNLYTIQLENQKYLIHKIYHFRLLPVKEELITIIGFSLITTDTFNLIKNGKFGNPQIVGLKIKEMKEDKLVGQELFTNSEIVIKKTIRPNNLKLQNTFQLDLKKSDETIVGTILHLLDSESALFVLLLVDFLFSFSQPFSGRYSELVNGLSQGDSFGRTADRLIKSESLLLEYNPQTIHDRQIC